MSGVRQHLPRRRGRFGRCRIRRIDLYEDRLAWNDGNGPSVSWSGVNSVTYAPQRVVNQAIKEPSLTVESRVG